MKADRLIIILGSPRSGTSWLGKIFDSHPATLFRHEPDSIDRGDYSFLAGPEAADEARRQLSRLIHCNQLKPAGTRPVFEKDYLTDTQRLLRLAAIYGGKAMERLYDRFGALRVPDFVDPETVNVVIKSVGIERAGAYGAAVPQAKRMLLMRHPCGHVDSVCRGLANSRFDSPIYTDFVKTPQAQRYGLTQDAIESMSLPLKVAWRWAIWNEKALEEDPGLHVTSYDELCRAPAETVESLFDYCGLGWPRQTADFISFSTSGDSGYFGVRRNPYEAANRWRDTFAERDEINAAIAGTVAFQRYLELSSAAS